MSRLRRRSLRRLLLAASLPERTLVVAASSSSTSLSIPQHQHQRMSHECSLLLEKHSLCGAGLLAIAHLQWRINPRLVRRWVDHREPFVVT
jgi:hypothetical protein